MMNVRLLLCALYCVAFVFGCSDDRVSADGWDLEASGRDAGNRDGGEERRDVNRSVDFAHDFYFPDVEPTDTRTPPEDGEVVFKLVNSSSHDIFLGLGVGAEPSCDHAAWLHVREDGRDRRLIRDCGSCTCGEDACGVCDVDCVVADEHSMRVEAGSSRTFEWDGAFVTYDEEDGCERIVRPESDQLEAEFCWATGLEYGIAQAVPTNVECASVSFDRLEDDTVEFEVTDADVTQPTTHIELRNDTDKLLYARPGTPISACYSSFVAINSTNKGELDMTYPCGGCVCSEVDEVECPKPCAAGACPAITEEAFELPPGQSRVFEWGGWAYLSSRMNGEACAQPFVPSADPLYAEFCWSDQLSSNAFAPMLHEPTCEILPFSLGDDVVHGVTP